MIRDALNTQQSAHGIFVIIQLFVMNSRLYSSWSDIEGKEVATYRIRIKAQSGAR